jgi:O-antigen ligase
MIKQLLSQINFKNIFYILTLFFAFMAPLSWKISRLIIILIIFIKIIQFDFKKLIYSIKNSKFLLIFLLFLIYQFLTLLWTETSYQEGHIFIRSYLLWFIVPVLVSVLDKKIIKKLITSFLFGMAVSEIIAYGMYFGLWTVHGHGSNYPSPFMHHTSYSVFMAFTAIILLNRLYSTSYTLKEKIIMGIFFTTVTGNLFISQGRIGQLAFAVAILATTLLHFKLRIKTFILSFSMIATIFFTAYQISPMFQKRVHLATQNISKIQDGNLNSSWGIRVAYLILGKDIIKNNLLLGVGLEDTKKVGIQYIKNNPYHFPQDVINFMHISYHFHNQFLMTTLQGGIINLFLLLTLFYYLFTLPIKDIELKNLSILFGIIFFIASISDPFLMYEQTRALFLLFTSLFVSASLQNKGTQ